MGRWTHDRYCDAVAREVERFADVARGEDPATPVPSCPDWSLADLIQHTGRVHRWAGTMVRDVMQERLANVELGLPDDKAAYPDWLAAGGVELVAHLRAADPDAAMWAWGLDQHARFWARRMLHETTVHRVDAELALGRAPSIEPDVAVDGVDEFLDNLPCARYFAPNVDKLRGDGEALAFRADGDSWLVTLSPDRFTWKRGGGDAAVTVTAPPADVMLMLYGRTPPVDVSGDRGLLEFWLENSAI